MAWQRPCTPTSRPLSAGRVWRLPLTDVAHRACSPLHYTHLSHHLAYLLLSKYSTWSMQATMLLVRG